MVEPSRQLLSPLWPVVDVLVFPLAKGAFKENTSYLIIFPSICICVVFLCGILRSILRCLLSHFPPPWTMKMYSIGFYQANTELCL